jgi:ribosomal protein S18 acetylase RimI-like enzyme
MNWGFPRADLYRVFFGMTADSLFMRHNHVYLDEAGRGAAMWLPPGVPFDLPAGLTQLGFILRQLLAAGPRLIPRMLTLQDAFSHHPEEPHYYLHAIGCRQDSQGQGIGSALLKTMTRRLDAEQMPAYLESSAAANTRLYERHGFETRNRLDLPNGGPPVWFMWRAAQP